MFKLPGKTTKRILSGAIPADTIHPPRSQPKPKPQAVRNHQGHALGTRGKGKK